MDLTDGTSQLGIWCYQRGKEIDYQAENLGADDLHAVEVTDTSGAGLTTVVTVLLPYDNIAHVVVGENKGVEPISIFVGPYLFDFERDAAGEWELKKQ